MVVTPSMHLPDQRLVPEKKGLQLSLPAKGFWVVSVSAWSRFFVEDRPKGVELSVLAQKVLAAEPLRRQVPNTHSISSPYDYDPGGRGCQRCGGGFGAGNPRGGKTAHPVSIIGRVSMRNFPSGKPSQERAQAFFH